MKTEVVKIYTKPLVWSAVIGPNDAIPHWHLIALTPFGRFVLAWNVRSDVRLRESPADRVKLEFRKWDSIEEGKAGCQEIFNREVIECIETVEFDLAAL